MNNNPFVDIQCPMCANGIACNIFIRVFKTGVITEAHKKNKILPKFGFHLAGICPACGWISAAIKQDDFLVGKEFMLVP